MSEINLLKNEIHRSPISFNYGSMKLLYIFLGIVVFELLLYGGMWWWGNDLQKKAQDIDRQAASIDFDASKLEADRTKAVSLQRRINNLEILLKNHLYWSKAFDEVEKQTLKTVHYTSLKVDEATHRFVLAGIATDLTDVGKLMLGLKQSSSVREVILIGTDLSESGAAGYEFNLEVDFDPKLLSK